MISAIATILIVFAGLSIGIGWRSGALKMTLAALGLLVVSHAAPTLTMPWWLPVVALTCLLLFALALGKRRRR